MKKLTIRLEDNIYNKLFAISLDNHTSVNKTVANILERYITNPIETNYLKEIDYKLLMISNNIDKISKRQNKHFNVSKQHFANFGYLSNANVKDDKCLNEILSTKDNFNE